MISRFVRLLQSSAPSLCAAVLCCLAGCGSSPFGGPPPPPHYSWVKTPVFEFAGRSGRRVCVEWTNPAGATEFNEIATQIEEIAHERGFTVVADPTDADFVCCGSLRYFDKNPGSDGGREFARQGAPIEPGYTGWMIVGQGLDTDPRTEHTPLPPPTGANANERHDEWIVVVDFAVGELDPRTKPPAGTTNASAPTTTEAAALTPTYFRREARLYGSLDGNVERGKAAAELCKNVRDRLGDVLPWQNTKKAPPAAAPAVATEAPSSAVPVDAPPSNPSNG